MADEPTFPLKRKPAINGDEESPDHHNKAHKLQTPDEEAKHSDASLISSDNVDAVTGHSEKKVEKTESDVVAEDKAGGGGEIDGGDAEDDGGEEPNREVVVDRKGKGILIEEDDEEDVVDSDDSDDDDDSSDGEIVVSDFDTDLSDDPLAEVDMNNILPSRTRGRKIHPGEYVGNDLPTNEEDDDSDDSDV